MPLSPEEKQARARAAQKKYRETANGREMRRQAAERYRKKHLDKHRRDVRVWNRRYKGVKDPTDETRSGPCEICGEHQDPLHFDHDRETGLHRGWLCGLCNRGIGALKHSPDVLLRAAEYLKAFNATI